MTTTRSNGGCERRGRGLTPGLAAVFALAVITTACGDGGPPVSDPVQDPHPPEIGEGPQGERLVDNHEAPERLLVHTPPPTSPSVAVLFVGGRPVTPLSNGEALWADLDGDRIVRFDDRARVEEVLTGGPGAAAPEESEQASAEPLEAPTAVVPADETLQVEERRGGRVAFPADGPPERISPWDRATVGYGNGVRFAGHSILSFALAPIPEGEPLLWRVDEDGQRTPVGQPEEPPMPPLGRLLNSGWAGPAPSGGTYFASGVRPELQRFDESGDLVWTARWRPERQVREPRLDVTNGRLDPEFSTVHHGMARGPDGLVYLLAASQGRGADRLLVFNDEGVLLREGEVDPEGVIYADDDGRVYELPLEDALDRSPRDDRQAFPPYDLPRLGEDGTVRSSDHEGKVVLVNFWASWCPPCRREIPLLDEMVAELAEEDFVVVGLNADEREEAALDFLQELGGVSFPVAAGGEELRRRYGYRGLPYTVVLDREHRVAHEIYGFGDSIDPIRQAVEEVLAEVPDS